MSGTVSVNYTTAVIIPTITLSGVLSATDKRILISQRLKATVVTGLDAVTTHYTWSFEGGGPYADYRCETAHGTKTNYAAPPNTQAYVQAYLSKPGQVTISCTVQTTYPELSFTLKDTATSVNPIFTSSYKNIGKFQSVNDPQDGLILQLYGVSHPFAPQLIFGITTDQWVETPSAFLGGDTGRFTVAQMVTNRSSIDDERVYLVGQETGIDNSFPYVGQYFQEWIPATPAPSTMPNKIKRVWADGPAIWGGHTKNVYDADFQFYVFYIGPDGKICPFQQLNWLGKGTATYNSTNSPQWTYVDNGSKIDGTWIQNPDFPEWIRVITNTRR